MQPQQGQMAQGFSDPQAAGQPTMVGGQYVITVPQQSPAPTWMGVIMIIYALGMVVLGALGDIAGGFGLIFTLVCNAFCALMIAIPLMATGSNLE